MTSLRLVYLLDLDLDLFLLDLEKNRKQKSLLVTVLTIVRWPVEVSTWNEGCSLRINPSAARVGDVLKTLFGLNHKGAKLSKWRS